MLVALIWLAYRHFRGLVTEHERSVYAETRQLLLNALAKIEARGGDIQSAVDRVSNMERVLLEIQSSERDLDLMSQRSPQQTSSESSMVRE